ncbi:MAG: hypothetical protein E7117_01150 [Bacteroidales bacterium]|nr:hypothetical protein [Bacteroidales bacterium]
MAEYKIREVMNRRDLKKFVRFPDELYKGCRQYVPALHKGQEHMLMHSASLEFCKRKMWLAEDADGNVAGRICCIINPHYNEKYGTRRARFGWFDMIEDIKVARLLVETAQEWAADNGMDELHGPLQYNTFGRQGMLVEGFDKLAPFSCLYNYPYYVDMMEQMGFVKECDWVQYMMPADQGVDDKMKAIAARMMERYRLHVADFDKLKKDKSSFVKFFKAYNASFDGMVHNFIPFTDAEIDEEVNDIAGQLDSRLCCVLMDENEDVAAFGIAMASLSEAMRKAKGRLFPFGWYHVLKASRNYEYLDLMLLGAAPKWQNTGISALFHGIMAEQFRSCGAKWALANPQIETNNAVNVWERYRNELWLRRRCWIKPVRQGEDRKEKEK